MAKWNLQVQKQVPLNTRKQWWKRAIPAKQLCSLLDHLTGATSQWCKIRWNNEGKFCFWTSSEIYTSLCLLSRQTGGIIPVEDHIPAWPEYLRKVVRKPGGGWEARWTRGQSNDWIESPIELYLGLRSPTLRLATSNSYFYDFCKLVDGRCEKHNHEFNGHQE